MSDSLQKYRSHRREDIQVEPMWVSTAAVSGVYWFQIEGWSPSICHIHGDKVFFPDGPAESASKMSLMYGNCFYGPLPVPPSKDKS